MAVSRRSELRRDDLWGERAMKGRWVATALAGAIALSGPPWPRPTPGIRRWRPATQVPEFTAQAVDGSTRHVDFPKGSATVLLFFLSGCPTCHKMIPEWNRAYQRRPKNVNVIGVLLDREPPGFFQATRSRSPSCGRPGARLPASARSAARPTTIRVGRGRQGGGARRGNARPDPLGEFFRP